MKAYRLLGHGRAALVDVEQPRPGRGEVLLRVAAAGVCHSDLTLIDVAGAFGADLPVTLGHESAGTIEAIGPGVEHWEIGDAVAVYSSVGCGACGECRRGHATLCRNTYSSSGVQRDGGMAEWMVVEDSQLVDASGLDPAVAAAMTDAGLTAYAAVARTVGDLSPHSTVAVFGVGGLGHLAIQIVRALTPARVVAVDVDAQKLVLARECGADVAVMGGPGATERVEAASPGGVDAAFDFVGTDETLSAAARLVRSSGWLVITGIGGGVVRVGDPSEGLRGEVKVVRTSYGSIGQLADVLELARRGAVVPTTTRFPLSEADVVVSALGRGDVVGRAVLCP